jgi:hypothetical protein
MSTEKSVECVVKFRTARPLTQDQGMSMWGMGSHFMAIGSCTYQLTTAGKVDVSSLGQALEAIENEISTRVGDDQWGGPQFFSVSIEESPESHQ